MPTQAKNFPTHWDECDPGCMYSLGPETRLRALIGTHSCIKQDALGLGFRVWGLGFRVQGLGFRGDVSLLAPARKTSLSSPSPRRSPSREGFGQP